MDRIAFDSASFLEVSRTAGNAHAIAAQLAEALGIVGHNGQPYGAEGFLPRLLAADGKFAGMDRIAFDAQPTLVTTANAGIPAFLSNFMDPKLIQILVSPMKAAQIAGETKKGDWTTTVATFSVVESDGEVSTYGDFNNNGSVGTNVNFPQRQTYHFQTFTQWGEKELATASLAQIDWAAQQNIASALLLGKFQNQTYFFGVAGLQNYGLLNDPNLTAAILPTAAWVSSTSDQIYADIVRLFAQMQAQTNGVIDADVSMVFALSNINAVNLNKANQYGITVYDNVKKNYPNLWVVTAPEYTTTGGELVQMIVMDFEGQQTLTAAFTEKMRAHNLVVDTSSYKQKKSSGTYGTIIFRPVFVAQMLG